MRIVIHLKSYWNLRFTLHFFFQAPVFLKNIFCVATYYGYIMGIYVFCLFEIYDVEFAFEFSNYLRKIAFNVDILSNDIWQKSLNIEII